ncbi:flagellar hook-associated protein FlgK [Arsukibacterium sp.]|uniref:flagellar hook-associated protein FlgK n=1 Tax=Arsukibacterium sp. TaxID=1977258 RepID=UPI002FD9A0E9
MSDNLLKIGTTAVLASSSLLNTTSNNIANINTPGYVRQRTEYQAQILGLGVEGRGTTERLVNEFTLKQLRRDTSNYAYSQQYVQEANRVDALFSNPANSIATGMNDLFAQIQTANNDPTQLANRQLIIGSAKALLDRFEGMSNLILDQENFINEQLDIYVNETNDYIKQIAILNKDIAAYGGGASRPMPLDLLDKRDQAILKLSEMLEIKVMEANNGEKLVFMNDGQSLVVEQGEFRLLSLRGDPDASRKELQLQLSTNSSVLRDVNSKNIGGKLGAIVAYREEILDPVQTQLGQVALSLADALNQQNKLGMTLNGQFGGDLFRLPEFSALRYQQNSASGRIDFSLEPGRGNQLPPNNFMVNITGPDSLTIEAVDNKGNVIPDSAISFTGLDFSTEVNLTAADSPDDDLYGLQLKLNGVVSGDQFLLKPLSSVSRQIAMATNRPEDIALARPLRGNFETGNLGNGRIDGLTINSTDPASTVFSPPSTVTGAPFTIVYHDTNEFRIFDSTNTLIGTANYGTNNYINVFATAGGGLEEYGFDLNISGVPRVGDRFIVEYNQNGFNDNRNGLAMAQLQTAPTTRRNAVTVPNAVNEYSFNQSYATMVGTIGERTRQARTTDEAYGAILEQTTLWYESLSGVSLDEEAANLVRFQQSYAAAARILSTSQTIFDTLLQAVR